MAPGRDESDSGMESQEGSSTRSRSTASKEPSTGTGTASKEPSATEAASASNEASSEYSGEKKPELEDDYDDEPDETIGERLWGLTEMFPESVRNKTATVVEQTTSGMKTFYSYSRSAVWIVFSTSLILFAPVIFEVERAQMEEMQRTQQKQMLLGPNTAVSSSAGVPLLPQMHR